jgi:polyphenol oxidase
MPEQPVPPDGVLYVAERPEAGLYVQPHWRTGMPWLVQGTTHRGLDMSLFGGAPAADVIARWQRLRDDLGCTAAVHARQVHGAGVRVHGHVPPGLLIAPDADGHATTTPDALLAISVADCVPVFIVAPARRAIALLHAGWRGAAAGILERGIAVLADLGGSVAELAVHLGPAVCGACYEVGPDVPAALRLEAGTTHVDLRAAVARRALALGVPASQISVSTLCTRCGPEPFYSHRGGSRERQIAVLAVGRE